jgi:hypothetical protein
MSLPFLPEPEAVVVAPPKKGNTKKTLALWVILILVFLAIWQFLSPAPHEGQTSHAMAETPASTSFSWWGTAVITVFPIAFVILMFSWFMRAYRQNSEFAHSQEPGRLAMAQRRFAEAEGAFRGTLPRFDKQPAYRAVVVVNLATAQLHAGRFDDAIASCAEVERARTLLFGSGIRTRIATLTALVYGLRGDVVTGERWTTDARARIAKNDEDRIGHAANLCIAEAVIACRKGDHAGAVATLEKSWNELRYSLTADAMRIAEVVRAFAEAHSGIRASNTVAERLVRVEPVAPGELAFLGVEWPEMKAFLGAHGIA